MRFLRAFLLSVVLCLALTACQDKKPAEEATAPTAGAEAKAEPGTAEPAPAEAPKPAPANGDNLVSASIGEPSNLISILASDSSSTAITDLIYNGLIKIDKDLNLVGDLAESWDISEDGLTFTFHLRKNVRWHDGRPFTARDVLFTYQLMIDPNTPTAYAEPFKLVKKAEAPDDHTFVVSYERPLARAFLSWSTGVLPEHLLKGVKLEESPLARAPVGTGMYKMEKWEAGQRVTLVANDDYFDGRPHIDRMVIKTIPDAAAQMMELMAGSIDEMSLTPDQYDEKQGDRNFLERYNMFRYLSFGYTYLGFNLKDLRFQDKRVRQALSYAIDKRELIDGVLLGLGVPANGPFKPDMWCYNDNVKPYPFDRDKAKALLAEAGWEDRDGDGILDKDGQPFQFTIMTNQGNRVREQTGLIIQNRLKDIGVKVNLRIVEWAAFLKEYLDKRNFEAVIMGWTIPIDPDLYDVWSSTKTNPGELNFIGFQNAEVDRLIDEGRFTLDQAQRKKAYDRIQEIFHDEAPYVFLFVPDALPVISSRVIGPEPSPVGLGYNLKDWHVPKDQQRYTR